MVFMKEIEKVNFEKNQHMEKNARKITKNANN